MDQSELNAAVQKWLEGLLQPFDSQVKPVSSAVTPESQELSVVLEKLRQLLKLEELPKTSLRAGGTHLAVLARSVAAYLHVALSAQDVDKASRQLSLQTTKAIMSMFKLTGKKLTPFYHDDPKEGLARVMQMALFAKYDKYALNGCSVFHEKAPVFYMSDSGQVSQCYNVCGKFGIPQSSCCLIPCGPVEESTNAMNTAALEAAILKDESEGRVPVMVVAHAGTPVTGHVENMSKIREICDKHGLWMHVQGHAISSLCLSTEDQEIAACRDGDSMTLCPGTWFGLLSCPFLTLHKTPYIIDTDDMENPEVFPPTDMAIPDGCVPVPRSNWAGMLPAGMSKLLPLSLWLCLQYLGTNTLVETVSYCNNLTQHMIAKLAEIPGVRRFDVPNHRSFVVLFKYFGGGEVDCSMLASLPTPKEGPPPATPTHNEEPQAPPIGNEEQQAPPTGNEGPLPVTPTHNEEAQAPPTATPTEEPQSVLTTTSEGETPAPTTANEGAAPATPTNEVTSSEEETPTKMVVEELELPTCNVANAMIARDLQAHFTKVGISPLKLPHQGVCFKFDPINSFPEHSTSLEDVDRFIAALQHRVASLHTTALARKLIETQLKGQPNLRCLEFPSFFGSGFIQYVPTDWASKVELSLEEVNELNKMNVELSQVMAEKNAVFTPFQHGNFSCIMIKELSANTNLQEFLLDLLEETRMYEDNKKFLEGMSEKIIQGIQNAQTDLHKEKEQKEQEEGLLRNIPLVGSVWSWFSPTSPATPQGRQFDLTSGKVKSTEETYRYKMQVLEGKIGSANESTASEEATPSTSSQTGTPEKGVEPSEEAPPTQLTEEPVDGEVTEQQTTTAQ